MMSASNEHSTEYPPIYWASRFRRSNLGDLDRDIQSLKCHSQEVATRCRLHCPTSFLFQWPSLASLRVPRLGKPKDSVKIGTVNEVWSGWILRALSSVLTQPRLLAAGLRLHSSSKCQAISAVQASARRDDRSAAMV